jgi:hypothetical protein
MQANVITGWGRGNDEECHIFNILLPKFGGRKLRSLTKED